MYTHTHIYTVCFTDIPLSYIYIYIHIYSVSPHRVKYLFYRTDSPTSCTYIYIYALFHHTELTSVLPHRWPSFTTLEKPTIWMVTYLSPSYKPICTHIHTYILFVLQISHYNTCIYIHIYSVSPHRVEYLFYSTDSPLSYICIHICSVSPHRVNICFFTQMAQFSRTYSPLSYIYI